MKAYINGVGSISAQQTNSPTVFLKEIITYNSNALAAIEPDYKAYINPTQIRRMGRMIKMGVTAAQMCLKDAEVAMPDAILTGTGLGCIEDTDKFLTAIIENKEQFLTPTSFIQSTHNTVGGQIALLLKCTNYNFTYVHRGFSFESCVLDACMMLHEKKANAVLIGGMDELTPTSLKLLERIGHVKNIPVQSSMLLETNSPASIAGEGANFFILSGDKTTNSYAQVLGCKMIYKPSSIEKIKAEINQLLDQHNLSESQIDLVLCGWNGDNAFDRVYADLLKNTFPQSSSGHYKHLCGEYHTANAFGFLLASHILKTQIIPESVLLKNRHRAPKNILLYNHYRGINHTLLLLTAC